MSEGPRQRFGQHFLAPAWADKVVRGDRARARRAVPRDRPGPGALTLRLAPRVEHLTAIEIDRDLAAGLQPQLPPNVEIVVGDFLDIDLARVPGAPGPLRVAGNLPYNISSPILFKLLATAPRSLADLRRCDGDAAARGRRAARGAGRHQGLRRADDLHGAAGRRRRGC